MNNSRFHLYSGKDILASTPLDGDKFVLKQPLLETDWVSFGVSPYEDGARQRYRIRLGDIVPEKASPFYLRDGADWEQAPYFDSARGVVTLILESTPYDEDEDTDWVSRAKIDIQVTPSKITEAAYEAMFNDLSKLSTGLVFDLISFSRIGFDQLIFTQGPSSISTRSAQVEFRLIKKIWDIFGKKIELLAIQPKSKLSESNKIQACTGTERISPFELINLSTRGVNPRNKNSPRPFAAKIKVVHSSFDITEHRIILSFMRLLISRIQSCIIRANKEIKLINRDRAFRDYKKEGGESLYERFDLPRIWRLENVVNQGQQLLEQINIAISLSIFKKVQRVPFQLNYTPIFKHVPIYNALWHLIHNYMSNSIVFVETGLEERSKQTWRMYEQWVYLQLAAALRASGLICQEQKDLFRRVALDRFTIDLQRDTRLSFYSSDGRRIVLRYEPWIHTKPIAKRMADSVYYGTEGKTVFSPLSPDILIEVYEPKSPNEEFLKFAMVADAKYTKRVREDYHWAGVHKYQRIRSVETDEQIVRQVWIVYPGDNVVSLLDDSLRWTDLGPIVHESEFLQGELGLIPSSLKLAREESLNTAQKFIFGLLSMLGFPEAQDIKEKTAA